MRLLLLQLGAEPRLPLLLGQPAPALGARVAREAQVLHHLDARGEGLAGGRHVGVVHAGGARTLPAAARPPVAELGARLLPAPVDERLLGGRLARLAALRRGRPARRSFKSGIAAGLCLSRSLGLPASAGLDARRRQAQTAKLSDRLVFRFRPLRGQPVLDQQCASGVFGPALVDGALRRVGPARRPCDIRGFRRFAGPFCSPRPSSRLCLRRLLDLVRMASRPCSASSPPSRDCLSRIRT